MGLEPNGKNESGWGWWGDQDTPMRRSHGEGAHTVRRRRRQRRPRGKRGELAVMEGGEGVRG